MWLDYLASHAVYVSVLVIFAMGVVVIYGLAGVFSLGHQGLMALGAYAAAIVASIGTGTDSLTPRIGLWLVSLAAALALSALGGLLLTVPGIRLRGDYLALATIAFAEGIRVVLLNSDWLGGARGLQVVNLLPRASGDRRSLVLVLNAAGAVILAALCIALVQRLRRSRLGLALRAIRDDEIAARAVGLDFRHGRVIAFVVGGLLCGLAGWLYAHFAGHVAPRDFDFLHGAMLLMFVVLGGGENAVGAATAVVVVYALDEILKLRLFGLITGNPGQILVLWKDVLLATAVVALLIWKPNGILSRRQAREGYG